MNSANSFSLHKFNRILFWDPCLSPHKADLFEEFAKLNPELEIICCADQHIPDDRRDMGWTITEPKNYRNIISPDRKAISKLVIESPLTTLHLFSGIRWVPTIVQGLAEVKSHRTTYAIMSEPREKDGWRGKLRLLHSWLTEKYHRRNAAAILAIGRNGPPWFTAAGYSEGRIFPFAYFLSPPLIKNYAPGNLDKIRIGYLGRLVKMKGVFDLVEAVNQLKGGAKLDFAGSGPEEEALKVICASGEIDSTFRGVLNITEVGTFLSQIDVLVLASKTKDGWGAVVSEALMAGVSVITTPMVGASIVLTRTMFGRCVPANNPTAIKNAILDLKKSGELACKQRQARAYMATQVLSAHAGATYLMKVIAWLEGNAERPLEFYRTQGD